MWEPIRIGPEIYSENNPIDVFLLHFTLITHVDLPRNCGQKDPKGTNYFLQVKFLLIIITDRGPK